MFEDLNSPTWFEEIERQRKLGNLNKLLVVKKDHCALGFTGPIFTEPSGRGYLSGVGIKKSININLYAVTIIVKSFAIMRKDFK